MDAASLRRSCPPRGVPSQPAALPSFVPGAGCGSRAPRRPAPLAGTSPDGVPSCLCWSRPLLPAVLPVPSSPTKGVGTAGTAPPRQDVHVQVELCVAIAVPGAGRRGRAGHQHQSAALRGSVEAAVREIVGQVVPAVSECPVPGDLRSPPWEGAPGPQDPSHSSSHRPASPQPSFVTLARPASFSLCCPPRCDFNWPLKLEWNHGPIVAGNSLRNELSTGSQVARLHVG